MASKKTRNPVTKELIPFTFGLLLSKNPLNCENKFSVDIPRSCFSTLWRHFRGIWHWRMVLRGLISKAPLKSAYHKMYCKLLITPLCKSTPVLFWKIERRHIDFVLTQCYLLLVLSVFASAFDLVFKLQFSINCCRRVLLFSNLLIWFAFFLLRPLD